MTAIETTLRSKLGKKPDSLLFAWLADELRLASNLDAALPLVEEGLSRHPDFLPGLLVRAKILYDMNALEEAESTFRKVYRKDPFCLSAIRHLSQIATKLNRTSQAEQYLRVLHTMDPLDSTLPAVPPLRPTALVPRAVPIEDDPFAQLEPLPTPDAPADEMSTLDLAGALDAALDGIDKGPAAPEFFPADDDASVTSSDVGSAISSLFGGAKPAAPSAAPESEIGGASPFSQISTPEPAAIPVPPPAPAPAAPVSQHSAVKSPPPDASDLHGALDSLFGDDDDFIEESLQSPAPAVASVPVEETPAAQPAPATNEQSKPELENDLASALDSLFGDDDDFLDEPTESPKPQATGAPALQVPASEEELPGFESLPTLGGNAPDLDSILTEQLSSKSDLPDFSADLDSALQGPITDDELPGFDNLHALNEKAPDLDSILSEQLAIKSDSIDFTDDLESVLEGLTDNNAVPSRVPEEQAFPDEVKGVLDNLFADDDDLATFPQARSVPVIPEVAPVIPASPAPSAPPAKPTEFKDDVADAFSSLFADLDDDVPEERVSMASAVETVAPVETVVPVAETTAPVEASSPSSNDDVASALDRLFADEDESLDGLLGSSSDEPLRRQLSEDPDAPVDSRSSSEDVPQKLTSTLAEIYLEQGFVGKALQAYRELVSEKPGDKSLRDRLAEIEKMSTDK